MNAGNNVTITDEKPSHPRSSRHLVGFFFSPRALLHSNSLALPSALHAGARTRAAASGQRHLHCIYIHQLVDSRIPRAATLKSRSVFNIATHPVVAYARCLLIGSWHAQNRRRPSRHSFFHAARIRVVSPRGWQPCLYFCYSCIRVVRGASQRVR